MREIKVGKIYKHFKGHVYEIVAIAKDSDSLEEVVEWVENYEQTTSNKVIESSNSSNNSDAVVRDDILD